MYARADDTKIRVGLHPVDTEVYIHAFAELEEALRTLAAWQTDLSTTELQPHVDRVAAAEAEVEDLFVDVLSIEMAEKICSQLYGAIVQAKAAAGRFNGGDES